MALARYKHRTTGKICYVFEGEEYRLDIPSGCIGHVPWTLVYEKLSPNPIVIHTTDTYMSDPQLDSLKTIYELDRQLNIEAREEKELEAFNQFRKNT